ncbi:MAG: cyclophilin family peptidyl-prolyl cis-trans isomerase [Akkermansiaceae bacterium]|jgi:cyclophilin family peptidyl-prolyl cis-trans isomerase
MKNFIKTILASLTLSSGYADFIAADFRTSEGDFTVALDYTKAPLAVANFIHLAGKGDDILETRNGVPLLGALGHDRQLYRSTSESDAVRLSLTVHFIAATETMRAFYGIYQSETYIGGVEVFQTAPYYADITGQDRIRLELVDGMAPRYRITMRYPRPWLDARDLRIKEAPMYENLKINRVETGKRFYAGSMTNSLLEHPGYHFQDEILLNPNNTVNPFGTPFNSGWILAMDTLGPNRNGSRFFITTARESSWNGRYTAFGLVVQNIGRTVVQSIADTLTTGDQEPIQEMFIYDIKIRRDGGTAASFFEGYQQTFLPGAMEELCLGIERTDSQFSLVTPLRPATQNILYTSSDLVNYAAGLFGGQGPNATEPFVTDLTVASQFSPKLFARGFATEVLHWPSAQIDLDGARFSFKVTSGVDLGTLNFFLGDGGTTGSYTIDMVVEQTVSGGDSVFVSSEGEGTFSAAYDSGQGPYQGVFTFSNVTGPLNVEQLTLHFDSSRYANRPNATDATIIRRFNALKRKEDGTTDLSYDGIYQKLQ